ncbi:MAG: hypothetical protein P8H62_07720 [Henriciella sp.]|nr:hypothetical protein [Henriciella sp.]
MEISFNPKHYAHVPVYYWPWVWWQLVWLRGWAEGLRRDVLFEIAPNGKVHVIFWSDDRNDLRAWMWAQETAPRRHLDYMDNAAGDVDINYFVYAMGKALERTGHLVRWVWVRVVLRRVPPFEDSG